MKILFALNHAEHAEPLLRSAGHFQEHGHQLIPTDLDPIPQRLIDSADVILLQEPPVREAVLDCGKPVVLLERIDGAQLRMSRHYLDRVVGVIKGYCFRNPGDNNRFYDRAHVSKLAEYGVQAEKPRHIVGPPSPEWDGVTLTKIHAGYGFGALAHMDQPIKTLVDFDAARPIDVCFLGHVDYEGSEIETHRRLALRTVETWASRPGVYGAGRPVSSHEFLLTLLRSKVAISPWGWGEACHRDYQAMALGTVVLKPDSHHVLGWPDIFRKDRFCVTCRPDFADAHDRITDIVRNWGDCRGRREAARSIITQNWRPEAIAQRMAGLIEVCTGDQS